MAAIRDEKIFCLGSTKATTLYFLSSTREAIFDANAVEAESVVAAAVDSITPTQIVIDNLIFVEQRL